VIRLHCLAHEDIEDMTAGFAIRDRFGQDVFGTNSFQLAVKIPLRKDQRCSLEFSLPMDIFPGRYTLTAALHSLENHLENCYYWCDSISRFEVAGIRGAPFAGICRLPTTLVVQQND
jgi:lipopolysaccharide transport system ATP-binding protein